MSQSFCKASSSISPTLILGDLGWDRGFVSYFVLHSILLCVEAVLIPHKLVLMVREVVVWVEVTRIY